MPDEIQLDHRIGGQVGFGPADRRISRLAERQHGVVARRQALAAGLSRRAIDRRVEAGRLHILHRGVYAVGHRRITTEGRWAAAVLACGPSSVLSHRSAAQLWRLLPRTAIQPEVTRPTGPTPRAGLVLHRAPVPSDEVEVLAGIPVTSASRTILDLAATVSRRSLERTMNEAEILGLTSRLSIPELMRRYPRRRGSVALRSLLSNDTALRGVTRNEFEEAFLALVDTHGLPRPRFNADLAIGGRFLSVDCLWEKARLIVELDGRAVHGTGRAFEADRERDRLLLVDGWRSVRVTWRQLRDQTPALVTDLRALLAKAPTSTL